MSQMKKFRTSQEIMREYGDTVAAIGETHMKIHQDLPKEVTRLVARVHELRDEYKSAQNREKNVKLVKTEDTTKIVDPSGRKITTTEPEGPQAS